MFDLVRDLASLSLIQAFAHAKKPVTAVCHGPAAFINTITPDGESLLKGAKLTSFTNEEEEAAGYTSRMPFELETELNERSGGGFVKSDQPWVPKVIVSKTNYFGGPLITGQNPLSATGVAEEILKVLGL